MNEENKTQVTEQTETTTQQDTQAEIEQLRKELETTKRALTRSNTEAAENKRKLLEKMSEQEKAEAERAEKEQAIQEELKTLRAEKRVSSYTAKLIEVGYDSATAQAMAQKLPENLDDSFFASQKTFLENKQKEIETNLLKKQPPLTGGQPLDGQVAKDEAYAKTAKWFGL